MAYTSITFENPVTGEIKEAPVGYSWTIGFFVFFPALFRGDWKWFAIIIIVGTSLLATFESDTVLYTSAIRGDLVLNDFAVMLGNFIFSFFYNKLYIKDLIGKGFKVKSIESSDVDIDFIAKQLGIEIPRLEIIRVSK